MSKIILSGEDRYHMPSLFADKILFCKAPLQDKYFEKQGGWAPSETDNLTAYRPYQIYVGDLDFETGIVSNEKKLDISDNEDDIFCSPHAYRRLDGLIELTYILFIVRGKIRTRAMNYMYKAVFNDNWDVVSEPVRISDSLVQDCYCGVENARYRATSTREIEKPVIYIFDKEKSLEYRLKIGQILMIQRISSIFGSDDDLLFTTPTDRELDGRGVYNHFIYNLNDKSIRSVNIPNENPYKLSVDYLGNSVWSEKYGNLDNYSSRIKLGFVEFVQANINAKIDKETRRRYLWA